MTEEIPNVGEQQCPWSLIRGKKKTWNWVCKLLLSNNRLYLWSSLFKIHRSSLGPGKHEVTLKMTLISCSWLVHIACSHSFKIWAVCKMFWYFYIYNFVYIEIYKLQFLVHARGALSKYQLRTGHTGQNSPLRHRHTQSPDKMAFEFAWEGHFGNKLNLTSAGVCQKFPLTSLNAGFTSTCKSLVRSDSLPLMPVHPAKKKANPMRVWAHQSERSKYIWILKFKPCIPYFLRSAVLHCS